MKAIRLGALAVCLTTALMAQAQEITGSAEAGSHKNALCIGCHGIKGFHTAFPETYRVPKLSGQSAKYLSAALHAYKNGERKHPSMRTLTTSLSEQDIADLAAYYESTGAGNDVPLQLAAGSAQATELVTKGGCTGCHGPNFSKPVDPSFPKVAGQHADYLFMALRSYQDNSKPYIGRGNPIMGGVTKQFSQAELKVLAEYVGSLPGQLQTIQPARIR